jgi:adenylosuccinate lyase
MVPRYSRPEMTAIWSAENRFKIWWQIEVFAAEAMGRIGMIPAEDAAAIRKAYDDNALGEIDVPAIDAIEAVTKHDVIAFLTWAGEKLGPERRWRCSCGKPRTSSSPTSTLCWRCSSAAPTSTS